MREYLPCLAVSRVVLLVAVAVVALSACDVPPEGEPGSDIPGLATRWAAQLDRESPLPEYPRPQMARSEWVNLNGLWNLAIRPDGAGIPEEFPDRIVVPFPVESALSGVTRVVTPEDRVWYRRSFRLPAADATSRWLLHFGAVDWEAEVWVNGENQGTHRGGYDAFALDITEALGAGPEHELVVAVRDPTDRGDQPRGKQVAEPRGIWYTAVTGIWQTVWLEPVPEAHVTSLRIVPDLDRGAVAVTVAANEAGAGRHVRIHVLADGVQVGAGEGRAGQPVTVPIPEARLWSPDDPFLYDVGIVLDGGDEVESYFGMRSIALGPDPEGHIRLLLNGEPLFQYGLLDQGWWPDGLYTAPTDEALRFDVTKSRKMGFNLIRKHVKVEPARWYYHCDREGILVWQDMPSGRNESEEAREQFRVELRRVVDALVNHPSIVMWVPFNEGWGQHDTEEIVEWLKSQDPTRLVNNASGWTDRGAGDVMDVHRYPGPGAPSPEGLLGRAAVLGEFGGLGLPLPGHTWLEEENWGYRSYDDLESLNRAYADLLYQLRPLIGEGLAAAVYTQTTDVEIEVNGIMTYDREVTKLSDASAALNDLLYGEPPTIRAVVPTSRDTPQLWRYTTDEPGESWFETDYDDSEWAQGPGGFGNADTPGSRVRTEWSTSDLWLRRTFALESIELESPHLRIHHDEDAEVYLNGTLVSTFERYTVAYVLSRLDETAMALLRPGSNTLAVHVHQTDGGQYIDVGLVDLREDTTR